jgi:hypothetical protein
MLRVVAGEAAREDLAAGLDEIVRDGAWRMLAAVLEDEGAAACIAAHAGERGEQGRRLVVRNGHARRAGNHGGGRVRGPGAAGGRPPGG